MKLQKMNYDRVFVAPTGGASSSSMVMITETNRQRIRFLLLRQGVMTMPKKFAIGLGLISSFVVMIGAMIFTEQCAQELANQIHGTVYWSPYFSCMLAMIGLLSQGVLIIFLCKPCFQLPLWRRYTNHGITTTGMVVDRYIIDSSQQRQRSSHKSYKVILAYQTTPANVFVKEFEVKQAEYERPLVFLPDVPTSAVLTRQLHEMKCCSIHLLYAVLFCWVAPILWILVGSYAVKELPEDDFWRTTGLFLLLAASLMSSACFAYQGTKHKNHLALDGGAREINPTWFPNRFFDTDTTAIDTEVEMV